MVRLFGPPINIICPGFDYAPSANHWGIDIAGNTGEGVYATDAGVVVYAGWNNYGYGNMIMVDHGNNFQSLYAHLSGISVGCGQSVGQGDVIGAIGSTPGVPAGRICILRSGRSLPGSTPGMFCRHRNE